MQREQPRLTRLFFIFQEFLNFVEKSYSILMLLSKEIAVEMNLTSCKLKQFMAAMLKQRNIDLTPEQFLLIDLLWNQGAMSQQQLADLMQKDKNSVTKLVDAIERKGLVVRKQNPKDRRSNTVILTDKAHGMKNNAKVVGISLLDQMLEGIDEAELQAFLVTMRKLSHNMDMEVNQQDEL